MKQDEVIRMLREVIVESHHYSALTTATGTDGYPAYTVSTPHIVALVTRAVKTALAQTGPLPVAWYDPSNGVVSTDKDSALFTSLGQVWPLYSKQEWVELTDREIHALPVKKTLPLNYSEDSAKYRLVREVEAMLKEKNT